MPGIAARLALVSAVLIAPATASAAPMLAPLRPCYDAVHPRADGTERVVLAGSGFTPNALVDVAVDGVVRYPSVPIDGAGALAAGSLPAPFVEAGQRPFSVTVTEQGNPAMTATVASLVTRLRVEVVPRRAAPRRRVRFRGSGFTAGGPVYAHYLRAGRVRSTARLVPRTSGPCGDFDVLRPQFPFRPAVGRWTVQIDQHRRYRPEPLTAFVRLAVQVRPAR